MCIRDRDHLVVGDRGIDPPGDEVDERRLDVVWDEHAHHGGCLLYTSDAADERSSVDLGGRRIIKKKTSQHHTAADAVWCREYDAPGIRCTEKHSYNKRLN